jgi:hypothetical protein
MARSTGNRPAEIFGYPPANKTDAAQQARQRHWCPFVDRVCKKRSGLVKYPFGVCSAELGSNVNTLCPVRFEEPGRIEGVSRVLEDIALHYFGDLDNVIPFAEVKLPNVGTIDYVLVKHKPMQASVQDFVMVEFQADSTTSTGQLVQGLQDFVDGVDIQKQTYRFGMNTYDTIKRSMTQLMNKGIVYEAWNIKCYWVLQEYIYANLVKRYGFKTDGYAPEHASRFALYNLRPKGGRLTLTPSRYVSTTVDEVYSAMKNNPGLPSKDKFVKTLDAKLKVKLGVTFEP